MSIFGVVFKSLFGIERQKKVQKFTILTRKPGSQVRLLINRTWPIVPKCDLIHKTVIVFCLYACQHKSKA